MEHSNTAIIAIALFLYLFGLFSVLFIAITPKMIEISESGKDSPVIKNPAMAAAARPALTMVAQCVFGGSSA
ncbi:MAG TPA: hypothetical protein PKY63_03875 [Bacteroidales bacterium]|nr:hypothetical protein [Bacteroidales bacterium]